MVPSLSSTRGSSDESSPAFAAPPPPPPISAPAATLGRHSSSEPASTALKPPPIHPDDEPEIQSLLEKHADHDDEDTNSDDDEADQLAMTDAHSSLPGFKALSGRDSSERKQAMTSTDTIPGRHRKSTSSSMDSWNSERQKATLMREMLLQVSQHHPCFGPSFSFLTRIRFTRQTFPVLLLCMVTALVVGELLEHMQQWRVFVRIEELFILIPILLNLKGNLGKFVLSSGCKMNLAARFSTSANIGELDLRPTRRALVLGNLALIQVQALIVSLISGLLAFILGVMSRSGVQHHLQHPVHKLGQAEHLRGGYFEALLVLCVSMLAAGLSSAILGGFMCALVVLCRRLKINPDNLATPLASALGDMVTLVLLGGLSSLFALFMGTLVSTAVFLLLLVAIAVNVVLTFRNTYVQELLTVGWAPLFIAMAISSCVASFIAASPPLSDSTLVSSERSGSGLVLEAYVNRFEGFALFAPVFTALSGSAGAIFVSRISTALHSSHREPYGLVAFALFALTTPVMWILLPFAWITGVKMSWTFIGAFLVATVVQMVVSLALAYYTATTLWKLDYDPDVYALPLLSSFLDVTGQLALVAAFTVAGGMGSKVVSGEAVEGVVGTIATTEEVTTIAEWGERVFRRWWVG
ncbi:BZ3500_MvSof-1268-A1-R1_Chr8-1g09805 [Microbotryum saponariae]|uniref:BZ3500_MvSof-1268-A1-R1_Chr8-1g09805 protein n=1 Tax=Microbotryum saponariae TaxID=289078 RepID=A0A2X0KTZ2_9BASI|nr:BZ3500_MvSof-1268-A1-R1_Chr8-1g09805 [Microbotryum saponariae]SDA08091.1 BZ3501_MvSof-1269-A2-R1_Chr8-1g09528 [Microbotryum saponariae]